MQPSSSMSLPRRLVMSLIALLIVYGNVAIIFNPQKLGLPFPNPWPRHFVLQDAFLLTGMFTSYSNDNVDFVLGGRSVRRAPDQKHAWIVLDLDEMIPGRTGIQFTQLLVARHWDMLGQQAQRQAWRTAAKKIRARHNRLHPDRQIDAVRIGAVSWPLSPDGYRAGKNKDTRQYRDWFNEVDDTP